MRRILFLLCTTIVSLCLHAQSDEEQVLVFRHSGEVNLFYASRLDSITLSAYDADSTLHDKVVSQVFHSQDTTMVVPIAEIDSVAFGSRNAIEMRPNVKDMTAETDLPWILRFDGEAIYYRLNTPASVLPKVGQRLFYGLDGDDSEEAIFPYGLTAKATAVTTLADEIRVDIETVELNEIFSKFFYAGPLHEEKVVNVKQRRDPLHWGEERNWDIPVGDDGDIELKAKITLDGDAVLNPFFNDYLFADVDVNFSIGISLTAYIEDDSNRHIETFDNHYVPIGTLYRFLNFSAAFGAFLDAKGEMSIGFGVERNYYGRAQWTSWDGWNFPKVPKEEHVKDKAGFNITLDGTLFLGPIFALDIATVGRVLGARFKAKWGPEYEAKVSASLLSNLREYQPEVYGSVALSMKNKFALETYLTHRRLWHRDVVETKVAEWILYGPKREIELLPHYEQTRGVQATTQTTTQVTAATKVDNDILHEVETGFELLDETGEVVDSVFVDDMVKPDTMGVQGFSASFELPKQTHPEAHPLRVRPIFHYAGYTISAAPTPVMHDSHIMPITSYGTNGLATFISGASVVGTAKANSTVYHIGNYLPVPVYDHAFPPAWYEPKTPGKHIDKDTENSLFGTWKGEIDGGIVELTFKNDGTGTYRIDGDTQTFNYDLNNPQSGDVRLLLNDQTTLIFTVISVSDTTLILRKKGKTEQYTLNKQY